MSGKGPHPELEQDIAAYPESTNSRLVGVVIKDRAQEMGFLGTSRVVYRPDHAPGSSLLAAPVGP